MSETISPKRFHEFDWRVVRSDACGHFRTGSLAAGVALADAIAKLADAAGHQADVDLRAESVTVRLRTDDGRLTEREAALAEQISAAAREREIPADPASLQIVQIAIDAMVIPDVMPFWRAVLGYVPIGDEDVIDPLFLNPPVWFQQMDAPRPQRNRIHIDLYVPHDQAEARVAAALAAGGRIVRDRSPDWWTLADPEGNEVDVAPWPDLG
jgi:4a-hydroxytetrahydrobiopterin dehydratase